MRLGLAADHGGFALKTEMAAALQAAGHEVVGRELIDTFVAARFSGAERHRRRLAKVAALEETS